ncbi:VIT domain-containing protein [Marinicella sp. S1101]|uniref:VIT domain-containing protein n=1 Tax=Marinicella marina TaxID=2996016 RepID=UPI0022609D09|nr:VIT domain-containing protein [Marinicella marina]MCX7552811.1 VIT domain-containing protein [Marinicella marina]MDJ1139880.1 VIT domain-containing protein [Marinicella marina]
MSVKEVPNTNPKRNSIRCQLEQLANKNNGKTTQQSKQKKYHKLGLNWKDVVIFSLAMFYTTLYQVNAYAQSPQEAQSVNFDDITSGMMMQFNQNTGEYHSLQLVQTEYDVDVFGLLATIKLKQTFLNDKDDWITEGVYAFPMADKSAVYELKMTLGERVIEGEIHEKKQAEYIYEQAKADGLTATMVKQYRPNIFTADIANIGPKEAISVEITYQMSLKYEQNFYELRLPMAIKQRYVPDSYNAALPQTYGVQDAMYRSIDVNLDAGFELDEVRSLNHNVAIKQNFSTHQINLKDQQLYDRNDFVLRWHPSLEQTPTAAYFSEQKGGFEYSLLMVMPPKQVEKTTQPRNMTYIMDTSGSMHGMALDQAKDALLFALSELDAETYFNVIDFDSTAKALFSSAMPATPDNIAKALDFVDGFSSDGGTNMAPALQIAMQRENIISGYLNQIIFMTDGSVGNEAQIFDQIAQDIGDARLFTVAIGPAPNNYFMSKAAMFGRGTYTHIAALNQVNESMSQLFAQLQHPALTDVKVTWNTADVVQSPSVISDLYMGQPLIITSKTPVNKSLGAPSFVVSGLSSGDSLKSTWSEQITLNDDDRTTGISRLWARNKVEEMTDDLMLGGDYESLKDAIIDLALKHHLITEFTAMVAVDRNPDASRMAEARAAQQAPFPVGSLGWRWNLLVGMLMITAALLARRFS